MIKEDYCSCEVTELLKEKKANIAYTHYISKHNDDGTSEIVSTCTHQMAMKYLREKWMIVIQISPILQDQPFGLHYRPSVQDYQRYMRHDNFDEFNTHEQAVEAVLRYVLKNLI